MSNQPETQQRPLFVGKDDEVEAPYPLKLKGNVIKGFGRGGKELGFATANLPEEVSQYAGQFLESGILYGWASVNSNPLVYPMVMSFGWNPYYKNEKRSAEVHIMHKFDEDFYDKELRVIVAGFIRDERTYPSLDALIDDINFDIKVANNCLARPAYNALKDDPFLKPSQ
ncbi:riboflavin kinase [Rhizoclosmatium globosum]|uniref:Riboflavin kinase n=1 Tax=Rhizoclosmatium globosum TaxID=329046 RepID=A0A1Y2CQ63_9FUNG|nr:riboflavin kinase [Rhizoclosmatium globosum]|eukprot:ORY49123.1 riboflavin kinase [Rhizoclosmatium globosum]